MRDSGFIPFFLHEQQDEAAEPIEFGRTADIFTSPQDRRTEDCITGRFGWETDVTVVQPHSARAGAIIGRVSQRA